MKSEFIKRSTELNERISEMEVQKRVALEQIKNSIETTTNLVNELNALDVPVVNGVPVINLKIEPANLGNTAYVSQMLCILPETLKHLEKVGNELIDTALQQSTMNK